MACAGFNDLYSEARKPDPVIQVLCWAHGRRNFFKLAELAKAPVAIEAVQRIDAIFDVERTINGLPIEQRRAAGADRRSRGRSSELDARCARQDVTPRRRGEKQSTIC
jgi:transposase